MSEREDGILLQEHGDWETRAHWDTDDGGERRLKFKSWWRVRGDRWTWNDCSSLPGPAVDRLKALLAQPSSASAGDAEALASGNDTAWPLRSVLNVLANAADHLLRDHNCDEHGWEMTSAARDAARALLAAAPSPEGAPEGCIIDGCRSPAHDGGDTCVVHADGLDEPEGAR